MNFFLIACSSPKYVLNTKFLNNPGSTEMAILIINQDDKINQELSQKIANVYKDQKGYNTTASFFSEQFITDGVFDKLYNQKEIDIKKLGLLKQIDYLCLGTFSVKYDLSLFDKNMVTADISIPLQIISAENGSIINNETKRAKGVGFSEQQALDVAVKNYIKMIQ